MSFRILLISHHSRHTRGGAPLADLALASSLRRLGHEVDSVFYEDALPSSISGTYRQLTFPWAAARQLLRRAPPPFDIVESTAGDAWVIRELLSRTTNSSAAPVFSIRTHGLEHRRVALDREHRGLSGRPASFITRAYHYRYRLWEVARDLRAADLGFFLNSDDAGYALSQLQLTPSRVRVTPNGVAPEVLEMQWRERPQEAFFRLLFLGTWGAPKGTALLPEIVRQLFPRDPRFRLTCAGVQQPADEIRANFPPEFQHRIVVLERYDWPDLPGLLSVHGVLLQPSPAEGCSLALLEAMAAGLAPVATATGWAQDHLRAKFNGFPVRNGSIDDFVAATWTLATEPGLGLEVGRNARATVAQLSWDRIARERTTEWQRVIRGREDHRANWRPEASVTGGAV